AQEWNGIVYFLFPTAAKIRRYDLAAQSWLADLAIADTGRPAAVMYVDADGIYLARGTALARCSHDLRSFTSLGSNAGFFSIEALGVTSDAIVVEY
ncbi:hypothetical protein P6O77_15580, partial [Clostridium perfringens]|nr:hypothetical protein [Clostridium perfringens]